MRYLYIIGSLTLDDMDNGYYYAFTNLYLYLYTLVFTVNDNQFFIRLVGVVFCVILIMFLKLYVMKSNFKSANLKILIQMIDITLLKIDNIRNGKDNSDLNKEFLCLGYKLSNLLDDLKDRLGNFIFEGKAIFDLSIIIKKINVEIDNVYKYNFSSENKEKEESFYFNIRRL